MNLRIRKESLSDRFLTSEDGPFIMALVVILAIFAFMFLVAGNIIVFDGAN